MQTLIQIGLAGAGWHGTRLRGGHSRSHLPKPLRRAYPSQNRHRSKLSASQENYDENGYDFRLEAAEKLAKEKDIIVILKGAGTIIAFPSGETWINLTGNSGMATAGAGDVLTGMISGLLAAGYGMKEAAILGVYLHGLAGDILAKENGLDAATAEGIISKIGTAFLQALEGNHTDVREV